MQVRIDVVRPEAASAAGTARFTLSGRRQRMFMDGLDSPGASLRSCEQLSAWRPTLPRNTAGKFLSNCLDARGL